MEDSKLVFYVHFYVHNVEPEKICFVAVSNEGTHFENIF